MKIKLFKIPISDDGSYQAEMNKTNLSIQRFFKTPARSDDSEQNKNHIGTVA